AWEVWDGSSWLQMGAGSSTSSVVNDTNAFNDTTHALTRSGSVTFRMPKSTSDQLLAGVNNFWMRARLLAGGYEADQAPSIRSARVSYSLGGPLTSTRPEAVLGYNDFQFQSGTRSIRDAAETFELFRPTDARRAALYFGFEEPPGGTLPAAPLSLFICVDERAA